MRSSAKKAYLRMTNKRYGEFLEEVPREEWPEPAPAGALYAYRSMRFFVTVYAEPCGFRLSVIRTAFQGGDWKDGITWDELQCIKAECGYGAFYAVEVYPREIDKVNVANMRHLWVLLEPPKIGWFATPHGDPLLNEQGTDPGGGRG